MKADDIRTVVALANLGFSAEAIRQLSRISTTLHHLAERQCNGEGWGPYEPGPNGNYYPRWTDADEARAVKRTADLMRKAQEICDFAVEGQQNLLAYHQGDPRGCALYIIDRAVLGKRDPAQHYSTFGVAV